MYASLNSMTHPHVSKIHLYITSECDTCGRPIVICLGVKNIIKLMDENNVFGVEVV